MVIVRLKGGIGNQLFQFAFGRSVALERNEELYFDLTDLIENPHRFIPRDFKLTHLKDYHVLDNVTAEMFYNWHQQGAAALIPDDFDKKSIFPLIHDCRIKAVFLDGYYQNEYYFSKQKTQICAEIKDLLQYHYESSGMKVATGELSKETIAVHIRRGDYTLPHALSFHGICGIKYYEEAAALIRKKVSRPKFCFFSDDVEEAERILVDQLKLTDAVNMSSLFDKPELQDRDLVELALMSSCKHFIIANSSFSWWAAYLADHPQKIVVAPERWYQEQSMKKSADELIPKSWLRL